MDSLILAALFVVPGFVFASVKGYWLSTLARVTDRTLEGILYSFVVYASVSLLPDWLFSLPRFVSALNEYADKQFQALLDGYILRSYTFVLLFAWLGAIVYAQVARLPVWHSLGRSPEARVWDGFFTDLKDQCFAHGVWLMMKDGSHYLGRLRRASDTPGEREVWISNVMAYVPAAENSLDGQLVDVPFTDALISASEIARIFLIDPRQLPIRSTSPAVTTQGAGEVSTSVLQQEDRVQARTG
ncbi:DUF6338 family protein [Symbiobacterium terraclitae]|uniref:DUF6338 family protein n=1 Tax=Symbiobacterium terraclitae TaxID=557451 RepID=UPI0035B55D05